MDRYRWSVALVAAFAVVAAAAQPSQKQLAREILRELVEVNTSERHGTRAAAERIADRLRAAGFPAGDVQVIGPRPEKANVVARLRGSGKARPLLFLAHLDVVDARKEDWSAGLDPFTLTERDGYFYGRGTSDIKQEGAILVATLIRLRQERAVLERDVIVALTADEEIGGADGIAWLLREHRPLIDAAFTINTDAGGGQIEKGQRVRYTVQTSEKASVTFRLEVTDRGGHSSQPTRENAIYRLAEGLTRLARFEFPIKLNETTRAFLERMAPGQTPEQLAAASTYFNSVMRTTCVATMLEGGHAVNALPQTARAAVNCRILPEDSLEYVLAELNRAVSDPRISITALNELHASPASPLSPEVLRPIERLVADTWPGVPVVPVMDPWATDGLYLRRAGIPVYGVPAVFTEMDPVRAHGKDERIGVEAFYEGLEFMYRLVRVLSSG
jgi:acetylornithine deacetylase/succinyl-diaminopimelate desuccinylase-like protein